MSMSLSLFSCIIYNTLIGQFILEVMLKLMLTDTDRLAFENNPTLFFKFDFVGEADTGIVFV